MTKTIKPFTPDQLTQAAEAVDPELAPIREKRLRFETFPLEVFPKELQTYCKEAGDSLGADPSWIAVPMLSVLSAAVGNSYRIQLKNKRVLPAAIWTAVVGSSGCGKSPALKFAWGPVQDRQKKPLRDYQSEKKKWGKAQDGPPPVAPTRFTTDDATIEALVGLLQDNPRGLLLARDELAGLFDFGRYSNGGDGGAVVAKFLEIWNGGQVLVDRKGGGTEFVDKASVAVAGGIQPKTLKKVMKPSHRDNGLAARFLFVRPPERAADWYEAEISDDAAWDYEGVLDRLYKLRYASMFDESPDPSTLVVDKDSPAKEALAQFIREHGQEKADLEEDLAAAWQKLEDYAGRFALVLQLSKWAAEGGTVPPPKVADLDSMEGGITLARWFGNEAKRLYREFKKTNKDDLRDSLLEHLEKHPLETARDCQNGGPPALRKDRPKIDELLGELCNEGAIRKLKPIGRSPLSRYEVVP